MFRHVPGRDDRHGPRHLAKRKEGRGGKKRKGKSSVNSARMCKGRACCRVTAATFVFWGAGRRIKYKRRQTRTSAGEKLHRFEKIYESGAM